MLARIVRIGLPLVIVALGAAAAILLAKSKQPVGARPPEAMPPLVRVRIARRSDVTLDVRVHGTVRPRTETTLVAKVPGHVVAVAPSFETGGFFEQGEVLLQVDPAEYRLELARAQSVVAQAEHRLAREKAEADLARREWQSFGKGEADPLVLREPQLAEAKAALAAAQASVELARINLESTQVSAPYAGRLRDKLVDVGQFVPAGAALARIYAVDYAEVRLPIPPDQLAFLDAPLGYRDEPAGRVGPAVRMRGTFEGRTQEWTGVLVRTEAEVDPKTRMIHAIARVDDPYARNGKRGHAPLLVGMFVEAEIAGRRAEGVFVLPRAALHEERRVLIVDAEDRLRIREVDPVRTDVQSAVIRGGLAEGERVCVSPLDVVVDGMRVRTVEEKAGP